MATKVYMEALSPTMEEGRLVTWHKAEGDPVKSGDVLAEGATAPGGQLVGIIAEPAEDIAALLAAAPAVAAGATAPAAAPAAAASPPPPPPPPPPPTPAAPPA